MEVCRVEHCSSLEYTIPPMADSPLTAGAHIPTPYGTGRLLFIRPAAVEQPITLVLQTSWSTIYMLPNDTTSTLLTASTTNLALELARRRPLASKVKQHVLNLGRMPAHQRPEIWRLLLKVQPAQTQTHNQLTLELQSILNVDLANSQ